MEDDVVSGEQSIAELGVGQRFENPLPEFRAQGHSHALQSALPELWQEILDQLAEVSRQVSEGEAVLCHSDLHERQLICKDGELAALIDFGEAAILDRHWDMGSALYFHGPQVFAEIHGAYNYWAPGVTTMEMAGKFSLAIAMHHASRSRLPGKEHRLSFAARHVRELLTG